MKSVKQRIIDWEIDTYQACKYFYNDLTQEDVDYMVERDPWSVAEYLNQHPLLTQEHVDYIIEKSPYAAAYYLSHKLSEKNIIWLSENNPEYLKDVFK